MAKVVIDQLTRRFPEKKGPGTIAVDAISLTIEDHEFMVLVGPSGCGKSTTLRMIAGLEEISAGTISIDGRIVNDLAPKDRDIAMVFQNYALYPHMSVYDNLAFGLKLKKYPKAEIETRVRAAAVMLGLDQLLDRLPKALSGGQRQRVAVGRAIVRQPKVFLFDEPLSNLDAKSRVSTRAEISKLQARLDATMIYVTHDQVEAMTMGDRICVMNQGRIMQVDAPLALYERPANLFVAGFIGSPAMNFFRGVLHAQENQLWFREEGIPGASMSLVLVESLAVRVRSHLGKPVVLGIRPEHLHRSTTPASGKTVEAKVELIEPLGAETFLYLQAGNTPFTLRAPPAQHHRPGDSLTVGFDLERAHIFDQATERLLS